MFSASDLRKGLKVELDGAPYVITEFQFVKPGKGQPIYNCRLKHMLDGSTLTRSFRSNDKLAKPDLSTRKFQYSYLDGDSFVFMDQDYEQVSLAADVLGNARHFLVEDLEVEVLYYRGQAVDVTLPTFVEKTIEVTEPGARGDTATNVLKPAQISGGYEIQVPLFINEGDRVRIDTRTGEYAERAKKG